ncbi:MAG: hypothetical protein LBQ14_06330 [Treponema sp.]|jgi:hypothetical protein|nr:hypothetical protein [Treponema sp.]
MNKGVFCFIFLIIGMFCYSDDKITNYMEKYGLNYPFDCDISIEDCWYYREWSIKNYREKEGNFLVGEKSSLTNGQKLLLEKFINNLKNDPRYYNKIKNDLGSGGISITSIFIGEDGQGGNNCINVDMKSYTTNRPNPFISDYRYDNENEIWVAEYIAVYVVETFELLGWIQR